MIAAPATATGTCTDIPDPRELDEARAGQLKRRDKDGQFAMVLDAGYHVGDYGQLRSRRQLG